MSDTFGKRMKDLRKKKALGLRELGRVAGVPVSTLSCLETGARDSDGISIKTAKRLARALGVELNYFCGFYEDSDTDAAQR